MNHSSACLATKNRDIPRLNSPKKFRSRIIYYKRQSNREGINTKLVNLSGYFIVQTDDKVLSKYYV